MSKQQEQYHYNNQLLEDKKNQLESELVTFKA